jgi:uncharacterized protein (DUF2237 family)
MPDPSKNVLGGELKSCSQAPLTGFYRNGCCDTGEDDAGKHTVCAVMTREFLDFSVAQGNDLCTPMPRFQFPGLKPGDRWCVCVERWRDAMLAGCAAPVVLEATHANALETVSLEELLLHAFTGTAPN